MAIVESDVSLWHDYSDGSGTTVTDESGNGRSQALQNAPSWGTSGVPAGLNGYVTLNGTNQYGVVTRDSAVDVGANSVTMCAWVNIADLTVRTPFLFKGHTSGVDRWYLFGNLGGTNGTFDTFFDAGANSILRNGLFSTPSDNNTWIFVVVVRTASTNLENYKNGTSAGTGGTEVGGSVTDTTSDLYVGSSNGEIGANTLNGKMAQIIMFNRGLTSTELLDLYASGAGKTWSDYFSASPPATNSNFFQLM